MHRYAPLDYPWAVSAFLSTVKPRALWVMETELWPNWLAACEARHLPVTILNARLSERSCQRYGRFQGAFDALSRPLTHLLCQHQDDADRFHRLGIARNRLAVTGSIKFDIQFGDEVQARGRALRQQLGRHDLSGSPPVPTRGRRAGAGRLRSGAQGPSLRPADPGAAPSRAFRSGGRAVRPYGCVRRTAGSAVGESDKIYLGDTMGELPLMLAAADLAFVGGSLVPVGGHNLLEPAALGKPCLTGPVYFNFSDITRQLVAQGARPWWRTPRRSATG